MMLETMIKFIHSKFSMLPIVFVFLFLKDWLRFSVAFWHTFRGDGTDIFGSATKRWPWDDGTDSLTVAFKRSNMLNS